jgi:hypothetical protein
LNKAAMAQIAGDLPRVFFEFTNESAHDCARISAK